jgi:flagellar biosynthesis protein FliQ
MCLNDGLTLVLSCNSFVSKGVDVCLLIMLIFSNWVSDSITNFIYNILALYVLFSISIKGSIDE